MDWLNIIGIVAAWISIAVLVGAMQMMKDLQRAEKEGLLELKHSTSNRITYIALFLFAATFLIVAGRFLFTGETKLDANLTALAVTAALGLFAVFSLMSDRYFKNMEELKAAIEKIYYENQERQEEIEKAMREIDELKADLKIQYDEIAATKRKLDTTYQLIEAQQGLNRHYFDVLAGAHFDACEYVYAALLYNDKGGLHDRIRKLVSTVMATFMGMGFEVPTEEWQKLVQDVLTYTGKDIELEQKDQDTYQQIIKLDDKTPERLIEIISRRYPKQHKHFAE